MIVDLQRLTPRNRRQLAADKLTQYSEHHREFIGKYGYEERCSTAFDELTAYLAHYAAGHWGEHYDLPELGLFLFGPCETGKTYAMQILSGLFKVELVTAA
ncbi:hypothetical protein P0136_12035 [Lentisphaerota bacterium ZTH]|nr:hypothetical protein JYG24_10455 [Lentisphaerota bacterium]WET06087.1 hypothetical protein P0136_12035 [Lentisphaerota bacterium ZTH]